MKRTTTLPCAWLALGAALTSARSWDPEDVYILQVNDDGHMVRNGRQPAEELYRSGYKHTFFVGPYTDYSAARESNVSPDLPPLRDYDPYPIPPRPTDPDDLQAWEARKVLKEKARVADEAELRRKEQRDGVDSYEGRPWDRWADPRRLKLLAEAEADDAVPVFWAKGAPRFATQVAIGEIAGRLPELVATWGRAGRKPDLVVSGINTRWNLGRLAAVSGTVANAEYAARMGIPAIAISGSYRSGGGGGIAGDRGVVHWRDPLPGWLDLYAQLEAKLVGALVEATRSRGDDRLLPRGFFLNVHFPTVTDDCGEVDRFRWVWSRTDVNAAPFVEARDLEPREDISGVAADRLEEQDVIRSGHCRIPVTLVGRITRARWPEDQAPYRIISPDPLLSAENQYQYLDWTESRSRPAGSQEDSSEAAKLVREKLGNLLTN